MKILLADDDRDQLALRSTMLAHYGFETLQATSVAAALRLTAAEHPDCVVLDLNLPSTADGLRLIRELKQLDTDVRVFVLTGAPVRMSRAAERTLVEDVLVKGSSSSELVRKLKTPRTHAADGSKHP
jgi:DNA-binding response OmpR family regulator